MFILYSTMRYFSITGSLTVLLECQRARSERLHAILVTFLSNGFVASKTRACIQKANISIGSLSIL